MPTPLTLSTICGGAADEVFAREFAEVLKNMVDPNTPAGAAREITLKFRFKPMADRTGAEVAFACSSKLAPVDIVRSSIFLGRDGALLRAFATVTRQTALFASQPVDGARVETR